MALAFPSTVFMQTKSVPTSISNFGSIKSEYIKNCIYFIFKNAKHLIYCSETNHESLLLNPLNLTAANFEPRWPLKILIHGFNGNRFASPNLETRAILLRTQPVHVISADYSRLSRFPCYYPWAVRNAHVVARCLAQLVDNLIESGIYSERDIHLIGFSLGAQIAGLTANSVRQPLHRITGKQFVFFFIVHFTLLSYTFSCLFRLRSCWSCFCNSKSPR